MKKTTETQERYQRRAQQLLARFCRETDTDMDHCDELEVAKWLIELKPHVSASSWRQYKASLIAYFENAGKLEAVELLRGINSHGCKKRGVQTTARTRKRITPDEMKQIREYLWRDGGGISSIDLFLSVLLTASSATGVGPALLLKARIMKNRLISNKGREESIEINLTGLKKFQLNAIELVAAIGGGNEQIIKRMIGGFVTVPALQRHIKYFMRKNKDQLYESARNRLAYVSKKIWPGRKRSISFRTILQTFGKYG